MLGILCGLESEAKIARKFSGAHVACAAARPFKARELANELVASGAKRLLSFGIAGSLHASLGLGDLVIGTRVISKTSQWLCDDAWGKEWLAHLPGAQRGTVFGSETLVATAKEKNLIHQTTQATVVDMESQCAAEIAAAHDLPFMVVRAVCDDAAMNVPTLVMAAIADDGSVDVLKALKHLIANLGELPDLLGMISGSHQALSALRRAQKKLS